MLKRLAAGLCALTVIAGPVFAQSACEPAKLAAAVDRYGSAPFSALTWRVLQGKGDPMIDPEYSDDGSYEAEQRWQTLVSELAPDREALREVGWNCRVGYPLSVLEKRVGSLGRAHPYVKQWLAAQEQVLRACNSESDAVAMPPPMDIEPIFANLQKADRAYQEASIAFYRDKAAAIPLFRAIAGSSSPHRAAAAYNIANLLANSKQPEAARKEAEAILADPSMASVHQITRDLMGYIANQEDTAEGWSALIDRTVAALETPAGQINADAALKRDYARALRDIDFVGVRAKADDWWLDGTLPENPTVSKSLVDMSRKHPMVLWMMAGQTGAEKYDIAPWGLIGTKWQDRMSSLVSKTLAIQPSGAALAGPSRDMIEALAAKPDDATRAALWDKAKAAIAAAESSCGDAPETAAAGFLLNQAVRLSAMSGHADEAADALQAVTFKSSRAYIGNGVLPLLRYLAGQGQVKEARALRDKLVTPDLLKQLSADDFYEERAAYSGLLALIAEDEAHWKSAVLGASDPASTVLLNLLPTTKLWAFTGDEAFSLADRALFARAAWTRDYALRRKVVDEYEDKLWSLNPAMKDIADKTRAEFPKTGRENLRLLTILRSPRHNILVSIPAQWQTESIRPDSFDQVDSADYNDKNWWCPLETDRQLGALRQQTDDALGVPNPESYEFDTLKDVYDEAVVKALAKGRDKALRASPMVKAINWKEVAALAAMPSAPRKLTEAAIRWGKASKGDDGAPEALALAVRTARYGCSWHGGHGKYSRPAQELLKAKFGSTSWAADTPYWFDCMRAEWDKDDNKVTTCKPQTWPKQAPLK